MYHIRQDDDASVIQIQADLDIASSSALAAAIEIAAAAVGQRVIVSLEACPYCDSTALNVLARAAERLETRFFIVVPPASRIRRLFDITGLTKLLSLCDSLEEALATPVPR